jgi:hypothetical protein
MSIIRLALVAALVLDLSAATVHAAPAAAVKSEASLDELVDTIRVNRAALVAVNLRLNAEQAAAFWPLYERYQTELSALGRRWGDIIEDYAANFATLSDDKAMSLMTDYLSVEAERIKLRQSYLPQFGKILPGRTVARFFQIENKIDAVIRYDLASTIPVVEDASSTAPIQFGAPADK